VLIFLKIIHLVDRNVKAIKLAIYVLCRIGVTSLQPLGKV